MNIMRRHLRQALRKSVPLITDYNDQNERLKRNITYHKTQPKQHLKSFRYEVINHGNHDLKGKSEDGNHPGVRFLNPEDSLLAPGLRIHIPPFHFHRLNRGTIRHFKG